MKRITLTCDDPGKWFHDCEDCDYYKKCTFFGKIKSRGGKHAKKKSHKKTDQRTLHVKAGLQNEIPARNKRKQTKGRRDASGRYSGVRGH